MASSAIAHVTNYHIAPYYVASAAGAKKKFFQQYNVIVAIHRRRALGRGLPGFRDDGKLLALSAMLLRQWNACAPSAEIQLLRKSNQLHLVMMWTRDGPRYVLRSLTSGTTRLSDATYYTPEFEDLLIATAMQCRGKVRQIITQLGSRWAEDESNVSMLFGKSHEALRECVAHVFKSPDGLVQQTMATLKERSTLRGEWVCLYHDASHKAALVSPITTHQ